MYQPNSACIVFCYWLLNLASQRLSGPQRLIVTDVYNAAVGVYPVSAQTWHNFNLFTAWRKPYFDVYNEFVTYTDPTLLTNLIASFSYEGNVLDDTGNFNGTNYNITFNNAFGKVLQGAYFNGINCINDTNNIPVGAGYSFSLWVHPLVTGPAAQFLWATAGGGASINWDKATTAVTMSALGVNTSVGNAAIGAWTLLTISISATHITTYNNGTLVVSNPYSHVPEFFNRIGQGGGLGYFDGWLDIMCAWDRELTQADVTALYNAGAGIQYPF